MSMPPLPHRWNRFASEIVAVLALKVIALTLIWHAFFSQPLDKHLSNESIGDRLFDPAPIVESNTQPRTRP